MRQHGKAKRRTWRKIHLAICPSSHEVILSELTDRSQTDDAVAKQMMPKLPKSVKNAYGDGAYDKQGFYLACHIKGITPLIPPRKGARLSDQTKKPWMQHRNNALRTIKGLGGDCAAKSLWKKLCGYHRRSLAETCMYRFKQTFGGSFRSRLLAYQRTELYVKCLAMNKVTKLGMPIGYWLAA